MGDAAAYSASQPLFSFDWSGKKEVGLATALHAWSARARDRVSNGDGLSFYSRRRWRHFAVLLGASALMFALSAFFLPLLLLRPQKFCLFFTLGSTTAMLAFAALRGPLEQLRHMFSWQRAPFTAAYLGSMALTLYAALWLRSHALVLCFSLLQAATLGWYLLSYIPGGAQVVKLMARALASACCRRRCLRGSALLPL